MIETLSNQTVGKAFTCPTQATAFESVTPVLESTWDWRAQGATVRVHDQGLQGGGVIHAAVSAIEEHYQIKFQGTLGVPAKIFST